MNHPLILACCFSAFPLVLRCFKAHVQKELHQILGRIGQKHRYPMEFVHVIGGIMICFIVVPPCFDSTQYTKQERGSLEVRRKLEELSIKLHIFSHVIKVPFAAKKLDGQYGRRKRMARKNHPFVIILLFFAFPLVFRCLKTHVHKELHHILGRIGKKHRDPMELVHVVRRVDTVGCTE